MASTVARPLSITIVMVLMVLIAAADLFLGIVALVAWREDMGWITPIVTIIFALILLLLAKGIANGSSGARFIVVIVLVLGMVADGWAAIGAGAWVQAIVGVLISLLIISIFYTEKAKAFFAS